MLSEAAWVYCDWNCQTALNIVIFIFSVKTHIQHMEEKIITMVHCSAIQFILSQVLRAYVESLRFYDSVIGSHKSLKEGQLCQQDVHFTTWFLCGFARQQG